MDASTGTTGAACSDALASDGAAAMPGPAKRSRATAAAAAPADKPGVPQALAYIKALARQPTVPSGVETDKLRAIVISLAKGMYKGPPLGARQKKKAKALLCSPLLFIGNSATSAKAVSGGPSQQHTFGCLEAYLNVVAKCYYEEPRPDPSLRDEDAQEPSTRAELYLQRESLLGKLSSLWRERSPLDRWAPLEIAIFESAICIHGKGELPRPRLVGQSTCLFI